MGLIRYFAQKSIFVNLLAVFVMVAGGLTFYNSAKEVFPQIQLGYVVIYTVYSQAGPEEIEKLITIPIENAIEDITDIKEISSWSSEGLSMIGVELEPNVEDIDKVVDDIKAEVEKLKDLPQEAEDPEIFEISSDIFPLINVSLSGGENYAHLRDAAKILEEEISRIEGVGQGEKWGYYDRAIWIDVDKDRLEKYGLTLFNFISVLQDRDISMPVGNKVFGQKEYSLRFLSPMDNARDVKNVIIRSNEAGHHVQVRDVARVSDGFKDEELYMRSQGKRAVMLQVMKHRGYDSIKITREVRRIAAELKKEFPPDIQIAFSDDTSVYLNNRLKVLYSNGAFGALLVVFMLLLLLRPSVALATAIGLPVAFTMAFFITKSVGLSFNMISIFGFIMVLGMMVDDAIVVGENVYRHLEHGAKPFDAAIAGASEMIMPVIASVSTTIAAFLPLLMVGGMMGEFLSSIPKVVIIALLASLIECFLILPSHLADFVKPKKHLISEGVQEHWFSILRNKYGQALNWVLHRKLIFALMILVLLVASAALEWRNGLVFSEAQISEITVTLKTIKDYSLDDTEAVVKKIEKKILQLSDQDLEAVNSYVGMQDGQHGPPKFAPNLAQIRVVLHIEDERQTTDANKIVSQLREWIGKPAGIQELKIDLVKGGPPTGAAIDIVLSGASYVELQSISSELMDQIREITLPAKKPGLFSRSSPAESIKPVQELYTDFEEGKKELRLIVDEAKATLAGVNLTQASTLLRAAIAGIKLKTIKKLGEDIDVMVRVNENNITSISDLLLLRVPNNMGNRILLKEIVRVEKGIAYSELKHKNGKKSLSVLGTIDKTKTNVNAVNQKIKPLLKDFRKKFPRFKFETGGEQKEMVEAFTDLGKAFAVALFLIFIILATLFNSLGQPVIIMLAIPFGFIGVMLTLIFHGMPISFMAFMGFIGLTGVVVNDSLIMVSFINNLRKQGVKIEKAIIEGAKTRLRPVILTTVTTSVGLFPLAYGWFGGDDPMIKPMALVFAWGLIFATGITLFIIPCFLAISINVKTLLKRILKKDSSEPLIFRKFHPLKSPALKKSRKA